MVFTVIVPCYNSKQYLRRCLDSIAIQNFDDYEVIAIDDGSTDGTAELLDEYAVEFDKLTVYHFENAGVFASRKRGISLANGEYIIFVDSDDIINQELLMKVYESIKEFEFPDIIRYQANLIGDKPYKDHQRYNFKQNTNIPVRGVEALKSWSVPGLKYAVYWLFAFKRRVFSNVLFITELRCYEDLALIPILIASSKRVLTIDYVGYNYTYNNVTSLTNVQNMEAERGRALDFVKAYRYALTNFAKLDGVSSLDLAFFVNDYTRRLKEKYDSLPDALKGELADKFQF